MHLHELNIDSDRKVPAKGYSAVSTVPFLKSAKIP